MDNVFSKRFLISKGVDPEGLQVHVDYTKIKTQSYLLADLIQEAVDKALADQSREMLDIYNDGVKYGYRKAMKEITDNN